MKFKEIEVGKSEQIRALLTGIEERGSKAGTRYLILNFTDGEQTVTANYWNCTREEFTAKEGQVLDLRVDAKLYKGSTSYTVQSYLLTDESPEAYVTSAPMDPVDMFNKIHSFATGLGVYGMLVCTLLEENREKLLTWAAGKSVHHNIRGGLLYHMYTMLQSASQLYKVYKNILPLLAATTFSFGITALNELQELYNGKSIAEDSDFAYEVMVYINKKVAEFKEEDHILYAIYGTPAESLCGLQVQQFRAKYGVIKGVSDRAYVSNSFHCHVTEDISPVQKQDKEKRFWNLFNGGKIQYVRYPLDYNKEAIRSLVNRAMEIGFYEGVNLDLCYCNTCGYSAVEMNGTCPKCGSHKITQVDRMNGYLGITRNADGSSRYNDAKLAEIAERRSM